MAHLEHAILSTLIYYDLLDRPLTELEIYKYLLGPGQGVEPRRRDSAGLLYSAAGRNPAPKAAHEDISPVNKNPWPSGARVSFFVFQQTLEKLVTDKKIEKGTALYYLPGRSGLLEIREKRLKLAQVKWRKLKKLARWLAFVPFLRMVAVTGSLTAYNTRQESDFDLLIVAKTRRLWLARTFVMALTELLGARRHGQKTQDRICLNCFLTQDSLEISPLAKPRDIHSAQEYGRLTLLLETKKGLYQKFIESNYWLKTYLNNYPWPPHQNHFIGVGAWPSQKTAKEIQTGSIASGSRRLAEAILSGKIGEQFEKRLGAWQTRRISRKSETKPADQIFVSQTCLMFHPQSKSFSLMQKFNIKLSEINKA